MSTAGAIDRLVRALDDALPQTQCTRCGFPDCAGYARAIATGEASTDRCPPGGVEGAARLAAIVGVPALALDPAHGVEGPRSVAVIDEAWCIGCTLCLKACPVDAIVGASKLMHTVDAPHCTGCELCLPVCPVDCIALLPASGTRTGWSAWSVAEADTARERYRHHVDRQTAVEPSVAEPTATARAKDALIADVLARARAAAAR